MGKRATRQTRVPSHRTDTKHRRRCRLEVPKMLPHMTFQEPSGDAVCCWMAERTILQCPWFSTCHASGSGSNCALPDTQIDLGTQLPVSGLETGVTHGDYVTGTCDTRTGRRDVHYLKWRSAFPELVVNHRDGRSYCHAARCPAM